MIVPRTTLLYSMNGLVIFVDLNVVMRIIYVCLGLIIGVAPGAGLFHGIYVYSFSPLLLTVPGWRND